MFPYTASFHASVWCAIDAHINDLAKEGVSVVPMTGNAWNTHDTAASPNNTHKSPPKF